MTAETTNLESPHQSDLGNAERFVADHRLRVHYVHPWRQWLVWDGKRHAKDDTGAVLRLGKTTVRAIYAEASYADANDQRRALGKHALQSEAEKRIRAMLSLAESEPGIPVTPDQLDRDGMLLNVLNGTIDLRTAELRPHNPQDLLTKVAPVAFSSEVSCPTWLAFLERVMDADAELIAFLQRAIGYSLTADTSEQCLFVLHGTGANGKTTFLSTIAALLGDYAESTSTDTFMVHHADGPRNDVARLRGARFISAAEAEDGRRLNEVLIKQMTGGDALVARFMYGEFFTFSPAFKIWLAVNHKPIIRGTDLAIWRRIRLIPFTVTIPPEEQDRELPAKLRSELAGILRWAVGGCLAWQRQRLGLPEPVRTATLGYRAEMDVLTDFLHERCVFDPEAQATAKELYQAFVVWAGEAGEKPMSQRAFATRLNERGAVSTRTRSARVWSGVRLRTSTDSEPGDASDLVTVGDGFPRQVPLSVPHIEVSGKKRHQASPTTNASPSDGDPPTAPQPVAVAVEDEWGRLP